MSTNYFTPEGNPCCNNPNHSDNEPYSKNWWACIDWQHAQDEHNGNHCDCATTDQTETMEYYTADVLYDMTHESNPYEWSGGPYNQAGF